MYIYSALLPSINDHFRMFHFFHGFLSWQFHPPGEAPPDICTALLQVCAALGDVRGAEAMGPAGRWVKAVKTRRVTVFYGKSMNITLKE